METNNPLQKRLILEILNTKWCKLLRIKLQTHRGDEFGVKGDTFIYKGFALKSLSSVGMKALSNAFYVLPAFSTAYDNEILIVKDEKWLERCIETVRVYNKYFAGVILDPDIEVIE